MELLTSQEVEQSIIELCNALEQQTELYAEVSDSAAKAEADYKYAFAYQMLNVSSVNGDKKLTAPQREAAVDLECSEKFRAWKIEDSRKWATKECLLSIHARLDAMRTLSATLRAQT